MSRKRSHIIETSGDNALTWFFVGILVIAAVAGLLGQVAVS
jgi:hypothetical protein